MIRRIDSSIPLRCLPCCKGCSNHRQAVCVVIFTIEYVARVYAAGTDCGDPDEAKYRGALGKLRYGSGERPGERAGRFVFSFYALIDLASILPWYINLILGNGDSGGSTFFRALRLVRMLKAEKYMQSFSEFDDVIAANKDVLSVTGIAAVVMWVFFSSVMYFTEYKLPGTANNQLLTSPDVLIHDTNRCLNGIVDPPGHLGPCHVPLSDSDLPCGGFSSCAAEALCNCIPYDRYRYRSVPAAMWITLLNLTGEVPLDAYTYAGRVVSGLMGIMAVASFAIPVGLLGAGFEDKALPKLLGQEEEDDEEEEKKSEADLAAERRALRAKRPKPSGTEHEKAVFKFVSGQSASGWYFHMGIAVLILLNVVAVILESDDKIRNSCPTFFDVFEWTSVVIFTVEFVLHVYSAREDKRSDYSRVGYLISFFGVIDILAILPCYVEGLLSLGHVHFNSMIFRVFRIFRILLLEHFTEAFTLLDDAFRKCKNTLAATGLLALIIWVGCATLFYIFEAHNDNPDYVTAFATIPNSMYYVAVFLGGEWAKTDFTVPGKFVAQFLAIAGIALYAIPIGAFFDAFQDICEGDDDDEDEDEDEAEENQAEHQDEDQEDITVNALVDEEPAEDPEQALLPTAAKQGQLPPEGSSPFAWNLVQFLEGKTQWGFYFEAFILLLILLSVVYAVISTCPSIGEPTSLEVCEGVVVVIFTVEYLLRLYSAFEHPDFKQSNFPSCMGPSGRARITYIVSFYALVDLVAILPWYIQYMARGTGVGHWMDDHDKELRIFRMFRLLKMDKYVPSVTLIDDAIRVQAAGLKITLFLATVFWIIFASLLYLTEKDDHACTQPDVSDLGSWQEQAGGVWTWMVNSHNSTWSTAATCLPNGDQSTRFQNVPNAMTFTMYLLTGYYPLVDFTFWGKVVNFFMVLFAVSIVAIPSGLLASGFEQVIEDDAKKRKAERKHLQLAQ